MSITKQEFAELVAKAGTDTLSEEEATKLEPCRSRNAVILAAGSCRRFAPISFDYPKALTVVNGEVLVERLIRQLHSVGVSDIAIVVGYKKEAFDYLTEKYGVTLIDAPDYNTTNNIVSLSLAADRLGGTYILLGDQYFTVNPFERFVYRSFYATTFTTSEDTWVMETAADGIVTDMVMREDGGEKLQGPCYVDAETGAALAKALEETLADPANIDKYWEYAWYLHRDSVHISTRYYPEGVLNSFKTMDEVRAFDDEYLQNNDSPSINNICRILECDPEDLHDFVPLMAGLTNYSVAFWAWGGHYVYRHVMNFGADVASINRRVEAFANGVARDCGVDPTFIYEDPEEGWKLCRFVEGARGLDREDRNDAFAACRLLGKLHRAVQGITVENSYSRWDSCSIYEDLIKAKNFPVAERTMSYRPKVEKLVQYARADNMPFELSHNDSWYANYIWGDDGSLNLIDWEFAAMADPLSDVAIHSEAYYISVPADDREFLTLCLKEYFGRDYTPEEWRHFMALVMVACWKVCMYTYGFFAASDATTDWDVDAWVAPSWNVFDAHLDYTLSLYEG